LDAVQVSLCFDRAHAKVWDFFCRKNTLLLAFRQSAHGRLSELHEGQKVIIYVPQSQGGHGLVGLGALTGPATVLEPGACTPEQSALGVEFRQLMRSIYSDPCNKPGGHIRSRWRFKMHREQIAGKGCGTSTTPWEFGVENWGSEEIPERKKKGRDTPMVFLPVEWEAIVPYTMGFFSIDWSSLGLADFTFRVCQLSGVFSRRLTTEHWAVIAARLKVLSAPGLVANSSSEEDVEALPESRAAALAAAKDETVSVDVTEAMKAEAAKSLKAEETQSKKDTSDSKEVEAPAPKDAAEPKENPSPSRAPTQEESRKEAADQKEQKAQEPAAPASAATGTGSGTEPTEQRERGARRGALRSLSRPGPATRRQRAIELEAEGVRPPKVSRTSPPMTPQRSPPSSSEARRSAALDDLLQSLGLGKYVERLRAEEVDLAALRLLSERDLADLGLPLGPRRKLQAAIGGGRDRA